MTPIVFKLGGEALTNKQALAEFLQQIRAVQKVRPVVIVHGGGPQVEDMMAAALLKSVKVDGLRATPEEQLPFVVGALAGVASQQLVAACKLAGINAIALSLADADLFEASVKDEKLGAVGEVKANNSNAISVLLENNYVVILNSIGCDNNGQTLNINADDAAVAAAQLIDAELCLLSNVPGVLDADKQLIPTLNQESIDSYIRQGVISDGMAVKVNAAHQAAQHLRRPVNIGSWQDSKALSQLSETAQINLGTKIQAV
ncbi:MAG: acetylglutamate kinase [Gammaproteobacteria bacterium]|nr:acetylglutamate kinase [Gammaproteobacteria bacterium]